MIDPFKHLGLASDTDEGAIKRAYAQRLRQTRPDDDPTGFQRLNEAYQAALTLCRTRRNGETGKRGMAWSQPVRVSVNVNANTSTAPVASSQPQARTVPHRHTPLANTAPAPLPREAERVKPATFDLAAFVAEYRQHCAAGNARALAHWLAGYPAFWHLPTKHAAGRQLLRMLFDEPEYMPEPCFAATSEFFHFDDALNGIDPMLLQRVRARGTSAWLLRPGNCGELALRVYGRKTVRGMRLVRAAIKRATGPFRWWRDLPHTLRTGNFPLHVGKVLVTLCGGNLADLPPPLDPSHARFWIEAASPGLGRSKLLMYGFRSAACMTLLPALVMTFIAALAIAAPTPVRWDGALDMAMIFFFIACVLVAGFWLITGIAVLDRKLETLAIKSRKLRIAMFSVTPAFCVAAILVAAVIDPALGTVAAVATMFVAYWRSRGKHRAGSPSPTERIGLYVILVFLGSSLSGLGAMSAQLSNSDRFSQLMPTLVVVAITLAIWVYDWHRRGFLRPKMAPRTRM